MGRTTRPGTEITDFYPDDTDTEFYIDTCWSPTLADVLDKAREKWGADVKLEQLHVEAEYIHTSCIGYDLYDPSDYTNFLHVTLRT